MAVAVMFFCVINNDNFKYMKKITYIDCPVCGKEFQSLGYASHMAMHKRERERAKKLQQPPVIGSVCPCGRCLDEVDIQFKQCYECGRYWGQTDL
jgi:hypothetical protein